MGINTGCGMGHRDGAGSGKRQRGTGSSRAEGTEGQGRWAADNAKQQPRGIGKPVAMEW